MLDAIRHGLGNLLNVKGRDARQAFWYYVLFVYLVTMGLNLVVTVPMTMQAMMTGVQQGMAQVGNPDPHAAEAAILGSMGSMFPVVTWVSFASAAILLVGLASAIARRAHDSDLSAWWAMLPVGLQAISIALIPSQIETIEQAMVRIQTGDPAAELAAMQNTLSMGALASWGAIIAVIVIGVRKSTIGPNRFGDAPFVA